MRSSRTARQSRHSEGDQRASIVEYALMIALIAVLVSASVLLLVAQISGQ
jgi:Flp pilus assembly pilin Flp